MKLPRGRLFSSCSRRLVPLAPRERGLYVTCSAKQDPPTPTPTSTESDQGENKKKKKTVSYFAPARSVGSQAIGPLHHTQGAHGMNYHHRPQQQAGEGQDPCGYYFFMPCVSLMGVGALQQSVRDMSTRGLSKVLVVTDKVLHEIGAVKKLTDLLDKTEIEYFIFDEVTPNPTADQVRKGVEAVKALGCKGIVSFGGGSPHDCAKGIGLVAANGGDISDYEGVDKSMKKMLPMVAINTTAGTASEMTRFCIITDTKRSVKMAIVDWHCTPDIAVDDPSLMLEMPKSLTAATGMDALTHSIEAYLSTVSTPITDACALHSMKLISTYLRKAVHEGKDLQARDMMSYAEFLAGMAFNSASLGYVHAMAHQLGGFYDLPHGVCNAILLPVVMEQNAKYVPELFLDLATVLGFPHVGDNQPERAIELSIRGIRALSKDVGIPENLQALPGSPVRRDDFDTLAKNALKDACGRTNPFQPTKEQVIAMYEKAFTQKYH